MKVTTPKQFNACKCGKVVFTNGCFDLIHVGHIRLLKEAKLQGDILVVGLNSDVSVRAIKGPKRPIIPMDQRAEVLSAIEYVDFILGFDTPTPLPLIKRILPDVLVKGEDWREEYVVGSKEVIENGGIVHLVNFTKATSTSNIIETIIWRDR